MSEVTNYQDAILNECRRERVSVTVFLTNGFQMTGTVTAFDNFVVVLFCEGKRKMIYKHAISTVVPGRNLKCLGDVR